MAKEEKVPYEQTDLYRLRHSAAHVMAQAVLEMFPGAQIAIGPPIEDGFYYDFDLPRALTPEDLEKIERRMRAIIEEDHEFTRHEVTADQAREIFEGQDYKMELIEGLEEGEADEYGNRVAGPVVISTYRHGDFEDLCRGPHVARTGEINPDAVKLLSVAGAYWRGDESRPMLQRIYGTAWQTAEELEEYLHRIEEAKKRDHRRLGAQLGLFTFSPLVGQGLPLWLPRGTVVRETLEAFLRQEQGKRGYQPVCTPHIAKIELYETSGHYPYYRDSQYAPIDVDGELFLLRPMNCPHHIEIFKSEMRSYRDLPQRYAEFGTVYRYEKSGELTGLLRVRGFTIDDAHLFVRPDQLGEEFLGVVDLVQLIFRSLGLEDYYARVGTRDPESDKYVGDDELWERATSAIVHAVEQTGIDYTIEVGEAAFYGPKLDFIFRDALGRDWQLSTVQVDYNLPERFDLTYVGEDNQRHRPVMIHRALYGSIERFIATLIEHYKGAFPVWLAPVQAMLIPIADRHVSYAELVASQLCDAGMRVEVDNSGERMANKIRKAQEQKVPYMLVMGDREAEAGQVALRLRAGGDQGAMIVAEFIAYAQRAIAEKQME